VVSYESEKKLRIIQAKIDLVDGIKKTYKWFLENEENFKEVRIKKRSTIKNSVTTVVKKRKKQFEE